ncbi:hypothetical protein [Micromonospora sp. NPDC048830]|uniref:LppU/SCO3897 family protein n=1 Tax=Micromonospora sp. NPDC048830 TaxID=3364257 RepID=UPI0037204EB5
MTSEGPHHPGQQPDEVSPGAGAPAPYGVANPDLGWAPPPPAARPNPPAPAWAAQHDQPPTAAWGAVPVPQNDQPPTAAWPAPQGNPWGAMPPGDQPSAAARGAAQVPQPQPGEPAAWGQQQPAATQPAWTQSDQAAYGQGEQGAPAWTPGQGEQSTPAWTPGQGEQSTPAWTPGQPAPNGNAQPDWGAQPDQPAPAWGGAAEPAPPAWGQAEPAVRGAARVPGPANPPQEAWHNPDDPARSGGWNATQQDDPAHSGGWPAETPAQQQDDPTRSGGLVAGSPAAAQDDPARSGGWTAGPPAEQQPGAAEQAPPAWGQAEPAARGAARVPVPGPASPPQEAWHNPDDPARSGGWNATQQDDPAHSGGWPAETPAQQQDARPEAPGWASAEPTSVPPARASASVGVDGPPAWGAPAEDLQPWSAERPAVPDVEPWAPGEAWGRAEAEPAAQQAGGGWEPSQPENRPLYQPAPAPGVSPANAVPLPIQEQRVPGASLAAAMPADYAPPAQFAPGGEPLARAEQPGTESAGVDAGWGRAEDPQSPAGPLVPAPRASTESGASARVAVPGSGGEAPAGGGVSASASVPMASRVVPPTDHPAHPGGTPTPQPRVYGRPARPEPVDEPAHAEEPAFHTDHNPPPARYDDPGAQGRYDDRGPLRFDEPQQHGFGDGPAQHHGFGEPPQQHGFGEPPQQHGFGEPPQQHGFGDGPGVAPSAFPPGVPSFADPVPSNRPMNGTRPHGGPERPGEQYAGPGASAAGHGAAPAPGPNPFGEPDHGGFPPAFPPGGPHQAGPHQAAPHQAAQPWGAEPEQNRFDSFKPDAAEPKAEAPTPKVRNGRVLAVVLLAAVLILAVPLGLLFLLGKVGGDEKPAGFNPAVGSCVKQSGGTAAAATCGEAGSFTVVSRADNKDKCADPAQPYVVLPGSGADRVLCLKPAGK